MHIIYSLLKKDQSFQVAIHLSLIIATLSAVVSCAFGLLLKDQDEYTSNTLTIHQWSGLATTLLATCTLYVQLLSSKRHQLVSAYRALLILSVMGVTVAGHYGATLTHGVDYLTVEG